MTVPVVGLQVTIPVVGLGVTIPVVELRVTIPVAMPQDAVVRCMKTLACDTVVLQLQTFDFRVTLAR